MKAYPFFPKRKSHDLNVIWDFKFIADVSIDAMDISAVEYDDRIPVPSAFDALPRYAGKRGLGIYRCFVDITSDTVALLKIGGAGMTCDTYVDGRRLGRHIGTYTPFVLKVPPAREECREIIVVTENRYDYEHNPLHDNFFDFYNYGGIIRQVWLDELPDNPILGVHVITEDIVTGRIDVTVEFGDEPSLVSYNIDGKGWRNALFNRLDEHKAEFTAYVCDPTWWSIDSPNLHILTVASGTDTIIVRFGLRQLKVVEGKILLNDKPLKLLGYCRHEAHPQFGPCSPDTLIVADLQLLKDMGCNFVRGAHYQQDPRFLDLCDELGFIVFSESLGWGQDSKQLTDHKFIAAQLEQTKVMINTDFNHPSIVLWGFLNEGASDAEFARECYLSLIGLIRSLDPSRLVTYATNRGLKDLFLEHVDVVSFNAYPGWYSSDRDSEYPLAEVIPKIHEILAGLKNRGLDGKPFIISEIGAAAIYGWRDSHHGFWTEEYQAELLKIICNETMHNDRIAGLALWQFCDCRTYQGVHSLMRPRTFNNKGTFDEYRRPKAACDTVRKIFTSA